MDLHPTDEQIALSDMAQKALADGFPISAACTHPATDTAWCKIAGLGLTGVLASEECGGSELTAVEACLIAHEAGRTLAPVSLLWAIIAARAASLAGDTAIAAQLTTGELLPALEIHTASRRMLAGCPGAEIILSVSPEQTSLRRRQPGNTITALPCVDQTTGLEISPPDAEPVSECAGPEIWLTSSLLISAAQTGIARKMLDMAVEHGQMRIQFGKPIGSFQAVRHVCSEMARRVEASQSLVRYAAVRLSANHAEAPDTIAAARVIATDAAARNGSETLQILGAMGMTAEHDLHLYIKRALLLERVLGRQRAELLELAAPASA